MILSLAKLNINFGIKLEKETAKGTSSFCFLDWSLQFGNVYKQIICKQDTYKRNE